MATAALKQKTAHFSEFGPFGEPASLPLLKGAERKEVWTSVPIIDVSALRSDDKAARVALVQELLEACQKVGFFYAKHHGIEDKVITNATKAIDSFFSLPESEKMKVHFHKNESAKGYERPFDCRHEKQGQGDMKEAFSVSGSSDANLWPEDLPGFREAINDYHGCFTDFAKKLHSAFAEALGLNADFFEKTYRPCTAAMRCLRYPPQSPTTGEDEVGIGIHTDATWLTLLLQDSVGGLEVQNPNGEWVLVTPREGTLVVNIGDYTQLLSGGKMISTRHRVVNRKGEERRSIAFFWGPNGEDTIKVAETCRPSKYDQHELLVKEYGAKRFKGSRLSHPLLRD